jgi:hypothetical protein
VRQPGQNVGLVGARGDAGIVEGSAQHGEVGRRHGAGLARARRFVHGLDGWEIAGLGLVIKGPGGAHSWSPIE